MKGLTITVLLLVSFSLPAISQDFQWRSVSGNLDTEPLYQAFSDKVMILGIANVGIVRSTDGGFTWQVSNEGIITPSMLSIQGTGIPGEVLCATADGTMYRSQDSGRRWSEYAELPSEGMQFLRGYGGVLYAHGALQGIYRSNDNGRTWTRVFNPVFDYDRPLALSVDSVGRVYFGTAMNGIYRSTDNGEHWEQVYKLTLKVDRLYQASNSLLYAWVDGKIRYSTDYGAAWTGFPVYGVDRLAFDEDTMYFTASGLLCRSLDSGRTYSQYGKLTGSENIYVIPGHSFLLWHKSRNVTVTMNQGAEEKIVLLHIINAHAHCVADSGMIYVARTNQQRTMTTSENGGATWIPSDAPEQGAGQCLDIVRDANGTIMALGMSAPDYFLVKKAGARHWIYRDIDSLRDTNWNKYPTELCTPSPGVCDILWSTKICRTRDDGASWTSIGLPATSDEDSSWTCLLSFGDSCIVVANSRGVAATTNLGASWKNEERFRGANVSFPGGRRLTVDRHGRIYFLANSYLLYSTDKGMSWSYKSLGAEPTAVSIDSSGRILVATVSGLRSAASMDSSWYMPKDALYGKHLTSVTVAQDGTIFVGCFGGDYAAAGPKPVTTASESAPIARKDFMLLAPYPNPFTNSVEIPFTLTARKNVAMSVYNILGVRIRTIASAEFGPGSHAVHWDGLPQYGRALAPGCYIIRMTIDAEEHTKIVMKTR